MVSTAEQEFDFIFTYDRDQGRLYLSESTAKSHIGRIYEKLGAGNRAQALVTAMRLGLISSATPHA